MFDAALHVRPEPAIGNTHGQQEEDACLLPIQSLLVEPALVPSNNGGFPPFQQKWLVIRLPSHLLGCTGFSIYIPGAEVRQAEAGCGIGIDLCMAVRKCFARGSWVGPEEAGAGLLANRVETEICWVGREG